MLQVLDVVKELTFTEETVNVDETYVTKLFDLKKLISVASIFLWQFFSDPCLIS